jgi:hypothetical protein
LEANTKRRKVEHKVYYDGDYGIGHVDIIGELTRDDAERIIASLEDMFNGKGHCYVLTMMSTPSSFPLGQGAQKALGREGNNPDLSRIAIVGAESVIRMLAKVIVTVLGKADNSRFLKVEEKKLGCVEQEK